jgi:multiple sugar transport system permease protein
LDNYIEVFSRLENFRVFLVSAYYFVGSFIQLTIALLFATILSFKLKGQDLMKGVLFFPNLINGVAISFIFLYFYRDSGTLNSLLRLLGFKANILWLTNPKIINYSLTATSIWRYMGFNMVMFLGAIQSIHTEIYEAASLDGANKWQLFRYIIWPSTRPVIKINLILAIKGAVSVFEIPYIMTGGGNGSATFVIRTVETAFKYNKVGLASAMAVVLTAIILLITAVQEKAFKERD